MMKELMMNEDFSDVTLVTEDKKQIKANINILSACSPVFKDILKKEKNSNHIMYLRGIQFPEMESIVQFIYLGEATFNEERMDEFLAVAKMLEIEELCNADLETSDEPDDEHLISDPVTLTPIVKIEEQTDQIFNQGRKGRRRDKSTKHKRSFHKGVKYACDQCDYYAIKQSHLTAHIQSKHDGVMFPCDQCNQKFKWRSMLNTHIKIRHDAEANDEPDDSLTPTRKMEEEAVVFNPKSNDSVTPTKVEEHSFVSNDNPKPAPKEIEEGVNRKYECGQCHKMFSFPSALCKHKQSVHKGVKYYCDQCEHQFTEPWGLKRHIGSKHAGIKYACDQCDHQYSQKNTLRMHMKNKHEA